MDAGRGDLGASRPRLRAAVAALLMVALVCSARAARPRVRRQTAGIVPLCTSEDGLEGTCTAVRACPSIDRLLGLVKRRRASPQQIQRLRRETLKCPFRNAFDPRVCCTDGPVTPPPQPVTPRGPRRETPAVTPAPVIPAPVTPAPISPAPLISPAPTGLQKLPGEGECGIKTFHSRIFGGKTAEIGSWPWVVSIGYHERGSRDTKWRCGGALIAARHVLTAAHCVHQLGSGVEPAMVRLGELDFNSDPDCLPSNRSMCADKVRDVPIESVHPHHQYKGRFGNAFEHDIAVVRLARSAEPYTEFVRPICLPVEPSRLAGGGDDVVGSRAYITGWGRSDEFTFEDFTPELQEARISIVSRDKCEKTYGRSLTAGLGTRLCAGEGGGVDTCRGDSGGPLMTHSPHGTHWYLTGVTSFGSQNCGVREAVYTRVKDYIDWVVSLM